MEKGIVYSEADAWRKQRICMSQHFSYEVLQSQIPKIKQIVANTAQGFIIRNSLVPLKEFTSKIAGSIIGNCLFGFDFSSINVQGVNFLTKFKQIGQELLTISYLSPYHWFRYRFLKQSLSTMPRWLLTQQEKKLLVSINQFRLILKDLVTKTESEMLTAGKELPGLLCELISKFS